MRCTELVEVKKKLHADYNQQDDTASKPFLSITRK